MVEVDQKLATKLVLSCKILAREGHSDMTLGHVSARFPSQEYIHMNPYGLDLGEMREEDIILIDLEGNKLAGERRQRTEYTIHTEIYKFRPEINSVIHTHPTYSIVLGAIDGELHPISHEGSLFPNLPVFKETTELIRTRAQGEAVARCLGQARALLLQNHGIVVVGQGIEEATIYAILLEKAAKIEILARQIGLKVWSSEEESQHKVEQIYHPQAIQNFWEYYVRGVREE
jgi:L-ribulose-5-phosphate 4-epimerase